MTTHYDPQLLADFLHGELPPEQDAAVHTHLERCAACRSVHDGVVRWREWTREAARAEEREFPAAIALGVWAAVRAPQPSPLARLRGYWRPLLAVPLAGAAVAAALVFGLPALQPPAPTQSVAASYYLEEHAAQTASNPLADRSAIVTMTALDLSGGEGR